MRMHSLPAKALRNDGVGRTGGQEAAVRPHIRTKWSNLQKSEHQEGRGLEVCGPQIVMEHHPDLVAKEESAPLHPPGSEPYHRKTKSRHDHAVREEQEPRQWRRAIRQCQRSCWTLDTRPSLRSAEARALRQAALSRRAIQSHAMVQSPRRVPEAAAHEVFRAFDLQ